MRPRFASPSRTPRGDGAAGGARALARHPWRRDNVPTSRGKATARAQGRRCASRRSTWPSGRRPFRGAPVRPAFALSAEGSLLESGPSSNRTRNIYRNVGITSIGIFRFPRIIFRRPAKAPGQCVDALAPARDDAEVARSRPCQSGALHLVSAPFGTPFSGPLQDAVVAQLVRAPVCGTGGRWFEPTQLYQQGAKGAGQAKY